MKLGQSSLPSQRVLMLIAGINHGRLVLDVFLTPLPPDTTPCNAGHSRRNLVCLFLERFPGATLHLGQGRPPRPYHVRPQGSAATFGAPAILLKNSRPQPILKFHSFSSLDYRAHHGLPVKIFQLLSLP